MRVRMMPLLFILFLSAEEESGFNVIGCTCTHGNTKVDYVCMNVLRTLETVNRQDVSWQNLSKIKIFLIVVKLNFF